ncbi:hypothetical protein CC80DRAFT_599720 [Byssothecium circinans]|uniref:Uncharacterized protein n=1 Tax=Byssothecium circinans TaxID=147558 RepID=A0A6A5TC89_9PLEO|nr:hypothetical protein CC80DRAFT_599720 [Byssothecium circinans]
MRDSQHTFIFFYAKAIFFSAMWMLFYIVIFAPVPREIARPLNDHLFAEPNSTQSTGKDNTIPTDNGKEEKAEEKQEHEDTSDDETPDKTAVSSTTEARDSSSTSPTELSSAHSPASDTLSDFDAADDVDAGARIPLLSHSSHSSLSRSSDPVLESEPETEDQMPILRPIYQGVCPDVSCIAASIPLPASALVTVPQEDNNDDDVPHRANTASTSSLKQRAATSTSPSKPTPPATASPRPKKRHSILPIPPDILSDVDFEAYGSSIAITSATAPHCETASVIVRNSSSLPFSNSPAPAPAPSPSQLLSFPSQIQPQAFHAPTANNTVDVSHAQCQHQDPDINTSAATTTTTTNVTTHD